MNWLKACFVSAMGALLLAVPAAEAATRQQEMDRLVTKYHQMRQFNGTLLVQLLRGPAQSRRFPVAGSRARGGRHRGIQAQRRDVPPRGERRATSAGFDQHLTKPIDREELRKVLLGA